MAEILIIDDDPVICELLEQLMEKINHQTAYALTGEKGLALARAGSFDIIFLDVKLPDMNGLDLIAPLKALGSSPEIIIITGERDPDGADLAITSGAWNYLEKPFFRQEINLQVSRALAFRKEKGKVSGAGGLRRYNILGESPAIERCLSQAAAAAHSSTPLLISGQKGTGKTTFAKTIHLNSDHWEGNCVVADCGTLDQGRAHDRLFGAASNGKKRKGLIAMAGSGTLVLEDVDQLSDSAQSALLRAMAPGPGQGGQPRANGFRIIATTRLAPEDLAREMMPAFFTSLGKVRILLPSLAERQEDLMTIAMYYMEQACRRLDIPAKGISPECLDIIQAYHWPGNVRELIQAMDKAVSSGRQEPTLYSVHLPAHITARIIRQPRDREDESRLQDGLLIREEGLKGYLERKEKAYLFRLFRQTQGDVAKACRIAGISRSGFYAKLKKHGLN